MSNKELLDILVCPQTKMNLKIADPKLIEEINDRILNSDLNNVAGENVIQKIDSGFIREDGKVLYPIRNDIPVMLVGEGISL